MLRVTIDLLPYGDETTKRNLGVIEIANDGTGTKSRGNYMVRTAIRGQPKQTWRKGAVKDFPRLQLGVYDLLLRALVATVGERNRQFVELVKQDLEPAEAP
jgi:hypothetical protein